MQIYFIRHGQSENNARWADANYIYDRNEDPDLTAIGKEQAEYAASFLSQNRDGIYAKNFNLTHLYTSLMVRAVATGACISKRIGIPLVAWEELHECGGVFLEDPQTGTLIPKPGKNRDYFKKHYPDLILPDSLGREGWWHRPFEEKEQRQERARRIVKKVEAIHGGRTDRIGIITHGGIYSRILKVFLGIDEEDRIWFTLNNTGMTRIEIARDNINLVYHNRTNFLPTELLT